LTSEVSKTTETSKTTKTVETMETKITETAEITQTVETVEISKTIETLKTNTEIQSSDIQIVGSMEDESIDALKQQLLLKKEELTALQLKYDTLQKMANFTSKSYYSVKKQYKSMVNKLKRLQDHRKQKFGIQLHEDQRIALDLKTARERKWSTKTIIDGLIYKMKWSTQGYSDFVKKFPIFPSVRTL